MAAREVSLTDRSLAALRWNYLGLFVRVGAQLVAQIALARLLGPEAFGLFAAAILLVGVGSILVEMGLGAALVQRAQITESDVRMVFTWTLVSGVVITAIAYALAGSIASAFDDARIADIIRGLTPVFLFQALTVVPLALLKRDLNFRVIQYAYVVSYIGGFMLVGIGLAYFGAGIWSLVAAWLAQSSLMALITHAYRPHAKKLAFRSTTFALPAFGSRVAATNLANWLVDNVDNIFVGRFLGPTALGFYSVSYNLVRNPANHLISSVQSVLFPASARAQERIDGLQRAYLGVTAGVALLAFPVFIGIAAVSDTVVNVLLGNRWQGAAQLLSVLSVAMAFHAVMAVAGPFLWGKGVGTPELIVQVLAACVLVLALVFSARTSVVTVAVVVAAVYAFRLIAMTVAVCRVLTVPGSAVLEAVRGGVVMAAVVGATLSLVDSGTRSISLGSVARLSIEICVGAGLLACAVLLLPRITLSLHLRRIINTVTANSPLLAALRILRRVRGH